MSLLVRPARMADKPALMAIAKKTWDGNDYLPVFFDNWVRDTGFWVAELKGRVVGCGKATHFGQGEWWLEGLRIDPDLQGRGLGTRLSFAILRRALEYRPRSLRLSTAEINRDSVHIIGRMGFEPVVASRLFWGKPGKVRGANTEVRTKASRVSRISARDALAHLATHDEFWLNCGLLPHTWKFKAAAVRYLAELERQGCLYGISAAAPRPFNSAQGDKPARRARGDSRCGLAGLLIAQPHLYDPRNLEISFASGDDDALASFGRFIHACVRRNGGSGFAGMATSPAMRRAFRLLGMKPELEIGHVLVFEHPVGD